MPDDHNGKDHRFEDFTIRDLFGLSPDGSPELAAGIEAKDFQEVAKQVSSLPQPISWSRVQSEVAGVLSTALNTSLLDAWAHAWEKCQSLRDDVEQSHKSPDTVVLSPLVEHSIASSLHPYIEIFVGAKRIQKITFDVTVTTQLKGLVLGLKDAHIVSLQLAQCEWAGAITTQEVTLIHRELKKLDLPGRITLKRSISLAGLLKDG